MVQKEATLKEKEQTKQRIKRRRHLLKRRHNCKMIMQMTMRQTKTIKPIVCNRTMARNEKFLSHRSLANSKNKPIRKRVRKLFVRAQIVVEKM